MLTLLMQFHVLCKPFQHFNLVHFRALHSWLSIQACLGEELQVVLWVQFYVLRKLIEHELGEQSVEEDDCYICSLSSRVLVYKGQLTPGQVRNALTPTVYRGA